MKLEDFFTLAEMKDGFAAPARVEELLTVMQKEKDYNVKNVCEASRQWSTVASTIAATENRECLDFFIQLDGLWFIDRWLKDVQEFSDDTSESFVEESITALLRALEKLHIDHDKSVSCGIWMTVKNLLGHNSSKVQDRARALFDSWKQDGDRNAHSEDIDNDGIIRDNATKGNLAGVSEFPESSSREVCPSRENMNEEKCGETASDEMVQPVSSNVLQPQRIDDVQLQTSNETADNAINRDGTEDPVGFSVALRPVKDNCCIEEGNSPMRHSDVTICTGTCSSMVSEQGAAEGKSDVNELNDYTDDPQKIQKTRGSENKFGAMEISSVSCPSEHRGPPSLADVTVYQESLIEPCSQSTFDTKNKDGHLKPSHVGDVKTVLSEGKSEVVDYGSPNHGRSSLLFRNSYQVGECNSKILQDLSGSECKPGKPEDLYGSFSLAQGHGSDNLKDHASNESRDLAKDLGTTIDAKNSHPIEKRRSDIEFDYSMVDAIEFARQVAIEVRREVVDLREPGCSSSEKISGGGIKQPDSPESINEKESQPIEDPPKEKPSRPDMSAEASLNGEGLVDSAENLKIEPGNCIQDMESSQVTEATQELEVNAGKSFCDFDLNQEVCSEDMDNHLNPVSTPISVVSVSRAAVATGLPIAPLQFEGALEWKGCAATSAFRPASPRRVPEGDKTLSFEGSSNSSRQRQDCLNIDLNVVDGGDDKIADFLAEKQILASSSLPSGESSLDASPRRSERLELDLNRVNDGGDGPSDLRIHHRNGHHSPSPSSSFSLSSMQPFLRNIDLNDKPSFCNDSSDQQPSLGTPFSDNLNASGGLKLNDSIISIMGTRVKVNRKDFVPQTISLPNGRISEPAMDLNLARSGDVFAMGATLPYAQSAFFGYNGLTTGAAAVSYSGMYGAGGPIPYMVDARGTHVVPQIVSPSTTVLPSPAFSQPPIVMNMGSSLVGSNGAGPSRSSFDLNSGLMMEGGNRESGGLRQLFSFGQGRSIDEQQQVRANSQASSSSGGGKRNEPDGGWEPYSSNYKRYQPPWK